MIRLVLENKAPGSDTQNKRMGWPERHEYFLDVLAKANHRPPAWPYNSSDKGFAAFKSWGKRLIAKYEQTNSLAAEIKRKANDWWRKLLPNPPNLTVTPCMHTKDEA